MGTLTIDNKKCKAQRISITNETLTVDLDDGRTISVPLIWYPRLLDATTKERKHWRLIGQGEGIHWPDLDEDISINDLLGGRPSKESQNSLEKWQKRRSVKK